MSSDELNIQCEDGQVLSADYFKDGQLQIVEVTPYDKTGDTSILSDLNTEEQEETKYLQVLDTGKNLVQLDLLNFTLVKCDNNEYQVVGTSSEDNGDTTITCVLANEEQDDSEDNQDSYVVVNSDDGEQPLVYLQSALQQINTQPPKDTKQKKQLTPAEILKKAKALQKAKALLESGRGGRRRVAAPLELLSAPNFKLYLYSCKLCSFKCNAIKEMSAHKAAEHASGSRASRGALQCARCPYRAIGRGQLLRHLQEKHLTESSSSNTIETSEIISAGELRNGTVVDVLVCGACGFESRDQALFKTHLREQHSDNYGGC